MRFPAVLDRLTLPSAKLRRARRRLSPGVRLLEDRQLLSLPPATATMTQTATFPNLESLPNVATQAFLYFSSSMGTLTEVDVVTSGSYTTTFHAENLGASSSVITGTTSANLAINVPSGAVPLTIPSLTETFDASPYDGTLNDAGTSGKEFAPETSTAAPQTTVLTSPAALADFTGNFRIPVTVSGHATGSATSTNGDLSDGFDTQTSVTLTITYHYIPNLPSVNPPASSSTGSQTSSTSGSGGATTTSGTPQSSSTTQTTGTSSVVETTSKKGQHASKKKPVVAAKPAHKPAQHSSSLVRSKSAGHSKSVKIK